MSNMGLHCYHGISDTKKTVRYIDKMLGNTIANSSFFKQFDFDKGSLFGICNWGVFGGLYKKDSISIYFDGYFLDDYKLSTEKQLELIHKEFVKGGIEFIKSRNFFGNILIDTPEKTYIITPQHTVFYLFLYFEKKSGLFVVAPAPKYIIPHIYNLSIDKRAIQELFIHEHCLNYKTLIQSINKIAPNKIVIFNKVERKKTEIDYSTEYWSNTPKISLTNNAKKDAKKINELFAESVKRCTDIFKNRPLTLSFSSGTDSSYMLSHMLDAGLKVELCTSNYETLNEIFDGVFNKLKKLYGDQVSVRRVNLPREKFSLNKIIETLNNRIDLRECSSRLYGDWHVYLYYLNKSELPCFSDGVLGEAVIGMKRIMWLFRFSRFIRWWIPNNILFKIMSMIHKKTSISDYYGVPTDCVQKDNCSFSDDLMFIHDLTLIANRMYGFSNDNCHLSRNVGEYYLSPFMENDFFRVLMNYPYREKMNYKLYYYLLCEQGHYFNNVLTDNIERTVPSSWLGYKFYRFNPFFSEREKFLNNYSSIKNDFLLDYEFTSKYIKDLEPNDSEKLLKKVSLDLYFKRLKFYKEEFNKA